ncbi:MAG: hypothetical protein EKK33_27515 [Bradyrhizobiaceae bacterium]|nr:MAG: hypothetical protein EKK33_27515 [Bradyrhizobiaceae bacterium]
MKRVLIVGGALLLGMGAVWAQQDSLKEVQTLMKGNGKNAGAMSACPAVVNAIVDALWREYKIDHIDMPATPERVWIAISEHHRRHSL